MFGEILVIVGTGFAGTLMMNAIVWERPLFWLLVLGFSVFTKARPGVAVSAAGTTAVTLRTLPELASTVTVVTRSFPFHCTTVAQLALLPHLHVFTKPDPITLTTKS